MSYVSEDHFKRILQLVLQFMIFNVMQYSEATSHDLLPQVLDQRCDHKSQSPGDGRTT